LGRGLIVKNFNMWNGKVCLLCALSHLHVCVWLLCILVSCLGSMVFFFLSLVGAYVYCVLCVVSSILCLVRLMCDVSLCLMSCVYVVVLYDLYVIFIMSCVFDAYLMFSILITWIVFKMWIKGWIKDETKEKFPKTQNHRTW
jgi:hypothetical protein